MSKPEEIPDTLYPDGNVPMPKAPGLATLPPASPRAMVSELQAIERCARGRGTPACDAIADRLAEVRAKLNEPYGISEGLAGGGETVARSADSLAQELADRFPAVAVLRALDKAAPGFASRWLKPTDTVPEGYAMVPVDPTEAMRTAHAMYGDTSDWWNAVLAAWKREAE